MEMPSKVEPKTIDELKEMHTGTLMKRRKALLKCEESLKVSDRYGYEEELSVGLIEFKDTPEWKKAYGDLKKCFLQEKILQARENEKSFENKKQSKQDGENNPSFSVRNIITQRFGHTFPNIPELIFQLLASLVLLLLY